MRLHQRRRPARRHPLPNAVDPPLLPLAARRPGTAPSPCCAATRDGSILAARLHGGTMEELMQEVRFQFVGSGISHTSASISCGSGPL
ncbi:hypothetical protein EJB05_14131, partial [Eragrostis curvula]